MANPNSIVLPDQDRLHAVFDDNRPFIPSENIVLDLVCANKGECLRALAAHAAKDVGLDEEMILHAVMKREALGSTGMGEGCAIPHARLSGIQRPFRLFARLVRPLDFDAIDRRPVDLLILLLFPEAPSGEQLALLAIAARILRNPACAAWLRNRANERAFEELNN